MHMREYFRAILKDWVARMSGPASVGLAFSAAYFDYIVKHGRAVLWIAAGLCFVITSYRVWAQEHSKNRNLESRLTPTLEVLFGSDEPFVQVRESPKHNATVTYHGIQFTMQEARLRNG